MGQAEVDTDRLLGGGYDSDSSSEVAFAGEEMMLQKVDWDLVRNKDHYNGNMTLSNLIDTPVSDIRVGARSGEGTRVMWVKVPNNNQATIHPVESVPGNAIDVDHRIDVPSILQRISMEPVDDAEVLWTLLHIQYPGLLVGPETPNISIDFNEKEASHQKQTLEGIPPPFEEQQPVPQSDGLGSWTCNCSHVNVGFKANCELCSSDAPAGWWKTESTDGPKLRSLRSDNEPESPIQGTGSVAIPKMAHHITVKVTRSGAKVGWILRNDDLVILTVTEGSPAAEAGLYPGVLSVFFIFYFILIV